MRRLVSHVILIDLATRKILELLKPLNGKGGDSKMCFCKA